MIRIILNVFRLLVWVLLCVLIFFIGVALLSFSTKAEYITKLVNALKESNVKFFIDSAKDTLGGKSLIDIWSLDFDLLNHKIGAILIFYALPISNIIYITLVTISLFLWIKKKKKKVKE